MADWLPKSILKFFALCRVWLHTLLSPDARETYHWDDALCVDAADEIELFVAAYEACAEDDSTRNRTAQQETRVKAMEAMRKFAASSVRSNPYMSDADRKELGLHKTDHVPTSHPRPASRPVTEVVARTINYGEHRVMAMDAETGKNTKPADAYGVRFVWQLGGERPASAATILNGKFSRRPLMTITFDETDRGKTVYYASCYENAKGDAGPWSLVVEAIIS